MGLAACPNDDTGAGTDYATSSGTSTTTASSLTGTGTGTGTSAATSTGGTTSTPPTTTATSTSSGTTGTTGSTTGSPVTYDFRTNAPTTYLQADRLGMPAVNTVLIAMADNDGYNTSAPTDDVLGTYFDDIASSLNLLHVGTGVAGDGLNDDIAAMNLPVCVHPLSGTVGDECIRQLGPFLFPDVLALDTTDTLDSFPNGRLLDDQAMDILLALVLLDVVDSDLDTSPMSDPDGVPLTRFLDIDTSMSGSQPLNPGQNDVPFDPLFPYLAAAH